MSEKKSELFRFKGLEIWRLGCDLVVQVRSLLRAFPAEERFALTDQLRRSALSIPSNIAEGSSRRTAADFIHFLVIARGSLAEVETQLCVAQRLGYVADIGPYEDFVTTIGHKLNAFIAVLECKSPSV